MPPSFDKNYWDDHWAGSTPFVPTEALSPNPYVVDETRALRPGLALDAGCGSGSEALWLASRGWDVTGADISATALSSAADRARQVTDALPVSWREVDLSAWEPDRQWDLVVTSYAHPSIPQLDVYRRIARWVAPGGTLLIVGHFHDPHDDVHAHHAPVEATATLANITAGLADGSWSIDTAREQTRHVDTLVGGRVRLLDVIVRASRRP